jgi:DNA-binding transcriptional LysR family regulator
MESTPVARGKRSTGGNFGSLRDLEVVSVLIDSGKMVEAAKRLGISQPAVSRTIAQLEQRCGRTLFQREGRSMVPTADATALYQEIQPIFETIRRLRTFAWMERDTGPLRIATSPTIAHCFLDSMTAAFLKEHPEVRVAVEIMTTPQVADAIADGRADVGVAAIDAAAQPLVRRIGLRKSVLSCAAPKQHALARKRQVNLTDLAGLNLIALVRRNLLRATIDRLLEKAAVSVRLVVETSNALSALSYVRHGIGVALIDPFPSALTLDPEVVLLPFSPRIEAQTVILVGAGKPVPPGTRRFVDFLKAKQPAGDRWSEPA